jgi:hypothetical protein
VKTFIVCRSDGVNREHEIAIATQTDRQTDRQKAGRVVERETDRQAGRLADRQTDRQAGR